MLISSDSLHARQPSPGNTLNASGTDPPRQRLRPQAGQRQRHRIGERQLAAHAGHLSDGHPGLGQEPVPLEHPGPAHLVRDPGQPRRPHRALHRLRPDGRDELGDLRARRRRGEVGRLSALRLELAAARAAGPPRRDLAGRAAGAFVQRGLRRAARTHPDEEHRLRRCSGRVAGHRHGGGRPVARGAVRAQEGLDGIEPQGGAPGLRLRHRQLLLPAAASAWRRWTRTATTS